MTSLSAFITGKCRLLFFFFSIHSAGNWLVNRKFDLLFLVFSIFFKRERLEMSNFSRHFKRIKEIRINSIRKRLSPTAWRHPRSNRINPPAGVNSITFKLFRNVWMELNWRICVIYRKRSNIVTRSRDTCVFCIGFLRVISFWRRISIRSVLS